MLYQALSVFCVALVLSAVALWLGLRKSRGMFQYQQQNCLYCGRTLSKRSAVAYCSPQHQRRDEVLMLAFLDRFRGAKTFHPEFFYTQSELDSSYKEQN